MASWPLILSWTLFALCAIILWLRFPLQRDRLLVKGSRFVAVLFVTIVCFWGLNILGATLANITFPDILNAQQDTDSSLAWGILYHIIDPGNQHMAANGVTPRLFTTILGLVGIVLLNGFMVSALFSAFENRRNSWLKGEVRYSKHIKGHIVFAGGGDMVAEIAKHYVDYSGKKPKLTHPIVILTRRSVEEFRREIISKLGVDSWRLIIYYGDRTSESDVKALNLTDAKEVFVLGEDPELDTDETYHDTMNMQCMKIISKSIESRTEKLPTHVMFEYQATFVALQVSVDDKDSKIDFRPFNYYARWSQRVLHGDYHPTPSQRDYIPLDGSGIGKDDDTFVHLIVVGMSLMGEALASTAAHLSHYPNFETKGIRTRITFINTDARQESFFFMERYPEMFKLARQRFVSIARGDKFDEVEWEDPLRDNKEQFGHLGENFIDIEWEFISGYVEHPEVRRYLSAEATNPNSKCTVAICFADNNRSSAVGITLPDEVYQSAQQVLIYQRQGSELIDQISEHNLRYNRKLRAFGMVSQCYNWDLMQEIYHVGNLIDNTYAYYLNYKVDNGKPKSAAGWSNTYHTLTMRSKARSYGIEALRSFVQTPTPIGTREEIAAELNKNEALVMLARTEHNRWNVEQLMLTYRPLTKEEQESAKQTLEMEEEELTRRKQIRKSLKERHAHLDICSNSRLLEVDEATVCYDILLTNAVLREYIRRLDSKGLE